MKPHLLAIAALLSVAGALGADAAGAKHVVVVVWDGLRPDSIDETNTPTLAKLAREGVFFRNHHSIYISSTEVNAIAMATGAYPNRSGVFANREYRPAIDPLKRIQIESPASIRAGDKLTGGHYIAVPTIAEMLRRAGLRTAIAGTKPVTLLHDRSHPQAVKMPGDAKSETPNTRIDASTTHTLTGPMWDAGVPAFSLLWLSEPDVSQHAAGLGSTQALAAVKGSDKNLALVLDELKAKDARDETDVFVVSDHGFSTVSRFVDVAEALAKAGFHVAREFKQPPQPGDVMVVGNGGSVLLYVLGQDKPLIERIVEFLQQQDFTGVIFTREPMQGTFTLDQVRINTADAPDIVVSMRWSNEANAAGIAGQLISDPGSGSNAKGNHASLSRYDMRATLIAAGPDFRRGMTDDLPTGNADLAPTILHVLGIKPTGPMDGRVLIEATTAQTKRLPPIEVETLESTRDHDRFIWHQYLRVTQFGGAVYFDDGNGASQPK